MKPLLIFVSGLYSAAIDDEVGDNIARACAAGKVLLQLGHWPFVPHCNVAFDLWHEDTYGVRMEPAIYYAWDLEVLRRCDALLYLAPSSGADRELALARELSLPVFLDVNEIPTGR